MFNSVINYSPSCRSKPVRPSSQIKKCWWNPRAFRPSVDNMGTTTFKAQKDSKDICDIYDATRILFVCKENKNNHFIQQFLCLWFFAAHSQKHHKAWSWYFWEHVLKTGLEEKKLMNEAIILVFFAHNKYYRSFVKLRLNRWYHMDVFNDVLTTILGLERGSSLVVYGGSENSWFSPKFLLIKWNAKFKVLWTKIYSRKCSWRWQN